MPGGSTVQSALVSTLNDCVARIVDAVDLGEVGSPYVSLRADESSIAAGAGPPPRLGAVRVWVNSHADGFEKLVHLHVFSARMTSHALFAFTAADSAVPHFSLGISATDGSAVAGFHVDLVSKVPHAAAPAEFAEAVYGPLAETRASVVAKLGGAGAVELSPVQREVMSRALIALRAAEGSAAPLAVSAVHVYLNHWLHLHRHRASLAPGCAPAELHRQDAMMRALLFSAQARAQFQFTPRNSAIHTAQFPFTPPTHPCSARRRTRCGSSSTARSAATSLSRCATCCATTTPSRAASRCHGTSSTRACCSRRRRCRRRAPRAARAPAAGRGRWRRRRSRASSTSAPPTCASCRPLCASRRRSTRSNASRSRATSCRN